MQFGATATLYNSTSPLSPPPPSLFCSCHVELSLQNECLLTTFFVWDPGDSRAVLSRAGKAVGLSEDHKPASDIERNRIVNAGGFLSEIGGVCRVNGNLNLSRAIGDLKYKLNLHLTPTEQIITAQPDIEQVGFYELSRPSFLAVL